MLMFSFNLIANKEKDLFAIKYEQIFNEKLPENIWGSLSLLRCSDCKCADCNEPLSHHTPECNSESLCHTRCRQQCYNIPE